ncbi:taste receptor type 2 member 7-like [Spea bombifrons]|uniref:taste receptor type 2 member 7-like n=1 Tax=Spea bombifrons TaxID=233779 RepID=UPI002349B255|nr:taste receptor type 2 member 7-like [Spea bombifrons]
MSPVITGLSLFITSTECMIGILFNFTIVLLNLLDWKQGRKLTQCDKILTLAALNNVLMQSYMNICTIIFVIAPDLAQKNTFFTIASSFQLFHIIYSFWVTSCLCFYYCLSIVNFKHRFLLRMKLKISTVVSSLLLVSGVGSFVFSILCNFSIHVNDLTEIGNGTDSMFFHNLGIEISPVYKVLIIVLGFCLPFGLAVVSVALTLSSLWTHSWRMKQNSPNFSFARVAAHVRAARIMVILVFLYAVFCIAQVTLMSSSWTIRTIWELVIFFLALTYPSLQSRALIFGNTKLRRFYMKICRCSMLNGY